ncbi:hypothetical protein A7985_07175 [Pseudoalteromonas luteoviolacea]|uniref:Calcineurin-like phosphoesterase domain-containing protein n=1 Tax=Pseudoalteromonas luteoviolacea TaxID=43657 RepID=A0A1C0TWP4_9GAMM|nr:hypothetical protein [Pseudoalteromonas luteoviolacea]MBQ4810238.1 hypothetical protein [Pseudoalteromonas luteoviolacea]OCQ23717.1 hypothetical protein A7985_07175 [Pseudoalteromonas luteoviolacea]
MNFKKTILTTTLALTTLTAGASQTSDHQLIHNSSKNSEWSWLIDWVFERAHKYAKSNTHIPEQNAIRFIGDMHNGYDNDIASLSMAACGKDKRSKWLAPWLSGITKAGTADVDVYFVGGDYSRKIDKYLVSTGTPYEIESKNYKRAGVKRFADFKYSWMISDRNGYTVINNSGKHDYNFDHVFQGRGKKLLNGVVFSDYEIGFSIGIEASSSGGGYNYEGIDFKPIWGKDMGVYGCGATQVVIETNTRPEIRSLSFTPWGSNFGRFMAIDIDIFDKHTANKNLKVDWTFYYDGRVLNSNPGHLMHPAYLPANKRNTYRYKVTVSDGHLTTVKQGIVR